MANQNPLAYTGRVLASTSRVGVCQFNPQDFSVSQEGVVSLGGQGDVGQATLTGGTVTVANTNITANDRILLSVSNINASTKLGSLTFTITPGTNFVINSRQASTQGSLENNDLSTIDYFIVRES